MKKNIAFRGGSYAIVLTCIVLALLVVVNLLAGALPANLTKLDISSSKLYSITSNTKAVVNALEQDVTIYWIVQSGKEDDVIDNLLAKYESLSDHIEVVKRNPDVYPAFARQYTDETVSNNSLVVVSGEKYRYVPYSDIYVSQGSAYSYSYTTSFDGEGAITSAIDYVVSTRLPILYTLEGHGETALPDTFASQLEKENVETESLSLLNVDEIPEDAAALMIHAPASDISGEEAKMLSEYVKSGGKLLILAGPVADGELTNLYGILSDYGVSAVQGIVSEGDRSHYAFQAPYVLLPDLGDSDITAPLAEKNYMAIVPIAAGLHISGDSAVSLLNTTDSAYSKIAGYQQTTYEKEDGDIDGPFSLGVDIQDHSSGRIIFFTSSYLLDDMYNAYSSGANNDMVMNALSALMGDRQAMSIRSKSLNYNYLTISESAASTIKLVMIGLVPLCYLAMGVVTVLEKRRMQR
ncbi:GldG family protein [Pseudoflavonifractor sp. MSJ-30]|uniref:GldG family protein n=1 Tax=Pseudoflavonifractor sp. MSJ-30 TaxID=2841525 RepID=UPI001C123898|nr:GldG family protein [Pseudoflavonifractor sp. MSJ-30]MBU5453399.1 GldG family protein [Pseudoflavonifractor sp. MSJ-30]